MQCKIAVPELIHQPDLALHNAERLKSVVAVMNWGRGLTAKMIINGKTLRVLLAPSFSSGQNAVLFKTIA